jgi:hypothetical protein
MHRPIGVTLLAIGAGLAALFQIWRTLVFLGIVNWTFLGKEVSFKEAQWGSALWAIILAAIWIWVAEGFWNVRAYAWSFGIFISLFTMIFGFFAILGGSTTEAESFAILLSVVIFFYLNYPGVQAQFVAKEKSLLTPEQLAALEQMQAAQAQMAAATAQSQSVTPPPPAAAPPAPPAPPAS